MGRAASGPGLTVERLRQARVRATPTTVKTFLTPVRLAARWGGPSPGGVKNWGEGLEQDESMVRTLRALRVPYGKPVAAPLPSVTCPQ
jgi:hypothetical protein